MINRLLSFPRPPARLFLGLAAVLLMSGCGGSSSSSTTTTTTTTPTYSTVVNTVNIIVDGQPYVNNLYTGFPNALYTTINICVPGTTTCQAVFNVLIDTGSSGLRLQQAPIYIPLTLSKDSSGNTLATCGRYSDGSVLWGPMSTVDLAIAGETASSVPIQLLGNAGTPAQPATCASGVLAEQAPLPPGANGILGIGMRKQDCGAPCATAPLPSLGTYFSCGATCLPTVMPVASQLQNPVAMFAIDNTGVTIQLPDPGAFGSNQTQGTLTFGIATNSSNNNFLGAAQILTPDSAGHFTTTFNGQKYPSTRFASGARAYYLPSTNPASLPLCPALPAAQPPAVNTAGYYCPASAQNLSAIVTDVNNVAANVGFSIQSAATLFPINFGFNRAFDNLGGPGTSATGFTWGLPFFMGRTVFVAIEGQAVTTSLINVTPITTVNGPFVAF